MDHVIARGKYDDDDILTTSQCAQEGRINRRTVLAWIHTGQLEAVRTAGPRGRYRIRWGDFFEAMHRPALRKQKKGQPDGSDATAAGLGDRDQHEEAVVGA